MTRPLNHNVCKVGKFRLSANQANQNNPAPKSSKPSGIIRAQIMLPSDLLSHWMDLTPPSVSAPTANAYEPCTWWPSAETISHFTVYVPSSKSGRENSSCDDLAFYSAGLPVNIGVALLS